MLDFLLAQSGPEDIFPFLLGAIFFMIPIVAILTAHQQKMARIMRGNQEAAGENSETMRLRQEVDSLRQLVVQQTLAIDSLAAQQRELAARLGARAIEERVAPKP